MEHGVQRDRLLGQHRGGVRRSLLHRSMSFNAVMAGLVPAMTPRARPGLHS